MTGLASGARLRGRQAFGGRGRSRTARELLTTLARGVLWLTVAVVLLRGVDATFSTAQRVPAVRAGGARMVAWPDDAARAFAVAFTTAYLTHAPTGDVDAYARALEAFASPELVSQLVPQLAPNAPREVVQSAVVAGAVGLDQRHALVTVAATVAAPTVMRRVVTVPIARDDRGGLVVYDLPAFGSAPARAQVDPPNPEPLLGSERNAIVGVLTPFLRAYLAGDTAGLAYLVPPGARIPAAAGHLELIELRSVDAAGPRSRTGLLVLATVQARDPRTRATYALRYRVRLERRDRWYVAGVNGRGSGQR